MVDDYRLVLEEYFGGKKNVPVKMEAVVKRGEEIIDERLKMLKMVDKVSRMAVDKYVADPLVRMRRMTNVGRRL